MSDELDNMPEEQEENGETEEVGSPDTSEIGGPQEPETDQAEIEESGDPDMSAMNMADEEITSEDKLLAALGYPIPIIPVIMLLMEDKKDRAFILYHAVQSLVLNVVIWVLITVISIVTLGIGALCAWILWFVVLWPAIDSFNGNYTQLPVLTDFMKNQGWVNS